jgi:membrane protease YdiL (CAAX protease family)
VLEVIALVLVAYAAIGEPVWGWFEYRRLRERRESDPRALVRVYRILLAVQWGWTALVLVAVATSPRLDLAAIGVRAPRGGDMVLSMSIGAAIALVASAVLMRRAAQRGRPVPGQAAYSALLPRTREERWYAAAAAVTAGVCEEVLYRGFFIATGVLFFDLSVEWAAALATVIFVVAHAYQGAVGLLSVTVLALVFTTVYLRTGSLLLPVALHVLVDLRALLLVPPVRRDAAIPSSPG